MLRNNVSAVLYRTPHLSFMFSFLFLVFVAGFLPLGGAAEDSDLQYLGTLPSEHNTTFRYAAPYFVNAVFDSSRLSFNYYQWTGGQWTLSHTAARSLQEHLIHGAAYANENWTVFVFHRTDRSVELDIANHRNKDTGIQTVALAPETALFDGFVSGDLIYLLLKVTEPNNGSSSTVAQYKIAVLQGSNLQAGFRFYTFPAGVTARDFALLHDRIFFLGSFTSGGNTYDGISWCVLGEDETLQISPQQWFVPPSYDPKGKMLLHQIAVHGSHLLINRQWLKSTPSDTSEMLITDWTDENNPQVLQTINAPQFDNPDLEARINTIVPTNDENVLAFDGSLTRYITEGPSRKGTGFSAVFLYRKQGDEYRYTSYLDRFKLAAAFGDGLALSNSPIFAPAYDLTVLDSPKPIPHPAAISPSQGIYEVDMDRIYNFGNHHEGYSFVRTLDARDLAHPIQKDVTFAYEATDIHAQDNILDVRSNSDHYLYRLEDDGSPGGELLAPPIPDENIYSDPTPLFWDDQIFLTAYTPYTKGAAVVPTYSQLTVSAFERTPDGAGELLSTFTAPDTGPQVCAYSKPYLIAVQTKYPVDQQSLKLGVRLIVSMISLQDPRNPVMTEHYTVPFLIPDGATVQSKEMRLISIEYPFLIYSQSLQIKGPSTSQICVWDLSHPATPKPLPTTSFLANYSSYGDRLFYENNTTITEFLAGPDQMLEVGRWNMQYYITKTAISGNRLYVALSSNEIEVYQLNIDDAPDETIISGWDLY